MRNAVLAAMAEMVLQVLSGSAGGGVPGHPGPVPGHLQAHCHDVNSCAQPRFAALHPNCPAEGEWPLDVTEIHRTLYAGRSKGK